MRPHSALCTALLAGFVTACALPSYQWVAPGSGSNGNGGNGSMDGGAAMDDGIPYADNRPRAAVIGHVHFVHNSGGSGGGGGGDGSPSMLHVYLDEIPDGGICGAFSNGPHWLEDVQLAMVPLTTYVFPRVPYGHYCVSLWLDQPPLTLPDAGPDAGGPTCGDLVSMPVSVEVNMPITPAPDVNLDTPPGCH